MAVPFTGGSLDAHDALDPILEVPGYAQPRPIMVNATKSTGPVTDDLASKSALALNKLGQLRLALRKSRLYHRQACGKPAENGDFAE
jgi:hypothetical protein